MVANERWSLTRGGRKGRFDCNLLGLGSKLYPRNMQRMLNKDLTRFMQSLSREHQNRASKRKALLAGCCKSSCSTAGLMVLEIIFVVFAVVCCAWAGITAILFCCKCSPCYQCCHRSDLEGRVIAVVQVPAQPMETTATTGQIMQVQLPPTVVRNNPTLPAGFNEPPPPYSVVYSESPSVALTETGVKL